MPNLIRIAKRCIAGAPFLRKELGRQFSIKTGKVFATPMTYYVIYGGRCNLACAFCSIHKHVEPELTGETMLRIIRQAKELSGAGFNISVSGGEPMIYKPLYESLELAQKLGVNFGFTTNGLALTKKNVEKTLSCNPFNVNISLESADPKVNESVRPSPGGTRKTLDGIDNLLAEKERIGARTSLMVKPTIMEQNYRSLPDLVRHFGKNSKVQVNFQPYVGTKGDPFWVQDLEDLRRVFNELMELQRAGYSVMGDEQQFQSFWDYLANPPVGEITRHLDLGGKKRNCDIGLRSMFINPNGDVYFCDYLKHPIGNVNKDSLSTIYRGAIADKQRRQMIYCNIDCQQTCKRPTPLLVKARAFLKMG